MTNTPTIEAHRAGWVAAARIACHPGVEAPTVNAIQNGLWPTSDRADRDAALVALAEVRPELTDRTNTLLGEWVQPMSAVVFALTPDCRDTQARQFGWDTLYSAVAGLRSCELDPREAWETYDGSRRYTDSDGAILAAEFEADKAWALNLLAGTVTSCSTIANGELAEVQPDQLTGQVQ